MPIYEYQCQRCGYQFEELQSFYDKPIKKCPKCKKNKVERLISLSAFHLQGSGWYETDYGKKVVKSGEPSPAKGGVAESTDSPTKSSDSDSSTIESIKADTKKAQDKTK